MTTEERERYIYNSYMSGDASASYSRYRLGFTTMNEFRDWLDKYEKEHGINHDTKQPQ